MIEKAPAKINLGLDVLYKRPDGYHELNMVMTSVDLADRLVFDETSTQEISISSDNHFLPLDHRNHIYQAIQALQKYTGYDQGVHIHLEKNIPVAAGLAGGSSDAAATLRGLNRLWGLNLSLDELAQIGAHVGSDVPYCVYGGTALVTGRGEDVQVLPSMPSCWIVLVKPKISVSTRTIFQSIDVPSLTHPNIARLEDGIRKSDYQQIVRYLGNSLEPITSKKYPIVATIKDKMLSMGADGALMSGSGPTVFAICHNLSRAKRVYNGMKGFCSEVYLVRNLQNPSE